MLLGAVVFYLKSGHFFFFFLHRFTLNNGKFLCSNPVSPWTKKAMRKLDEEAKQKRNHRFGLAPDAPKESTEGLLTATMMPLTSRWPQVPASVAMPMEKSRAESPANVKSSTPKKQKQRRKGRNKVGKRKSTSRIKIKIKIKKQPVLLHTSSFTMSSYK